MKEKIIEFDYEYTKAEKLNKPLSIFLPFVIQKNTPKLKIHKDDYFLDYTEEGIKLDVHSDCLLYTSPSPRD